MQNEQIACSITEAIGQFIDTPEQKENLIERITATRYQIGRTERRFRENLTANPPWVEDECLDEIKTITAELQQYNSLLDELEKTVDKSNIPQAESIKNKLEKTIETLNNAFFIFRDKALIAWGPFMHGNINMLIALCFKAKSFDSSIIEVHQELEPLIQVTENQVSALKTELEESPFKNAILQWNDEYIKILKKNMKIKPEELDKFIEELHILGNKYYSIDLFNIARNYASQNDILPIAELVLECSGLYAKEYLPAEIFMEILSALELNIEQIQSIVPLQDDSIQENDGENDIVYNSDIDTSALIESMTMMQKSIEQYYTDIDEGNTNTSKNESLLKQGIEKFRNEMKHLNVLAEREGKIPCTKCGGYSPGNTRYCEKCNAPLPAILVETFSTIEVMDDNSDALSIVMTTNIEQLFSSAESFFYGEISKEQFADSIAKFERLIERAKKMAPKDDDSDEILKQTAQNYQEGLKQISAGNEIIKSLMEKREENLLNSGKETVWKGVGILQEMQKVLTPYIEKK